MSPEGPDRIRAVAASLRLGMDAQGNAAFVGLVDWLVADASSEPAAAARLPRLARRSPSNDRNRLESEPVSSVPVAVMFCGSGS